MEQNNINIKRKLKHYLTNTDIWEQDVLKKQLLVEQEDVQDIICDDNFHNITFDDCIHSQFYNQEQISYEGEDFREDILLFDEDGETIMELNSDNINEVLLKQSHLSLQQILELNRNVLNSMNKFGGDGDNKSQEEDEEQQIYEMQENEEFYQQTSNHDESETYSQDQYKFNYNTCEANCFYDEYQFDDCQELQDNNTLQIDCIDFGQIDNQFSEDYFSPILLELPEQHLFQINEMQTEHIPTQLQSKRLNKITLERAAPQNNTKVCFIQKKIKKKRIVPHSGNKASKDMSSSQLILKQALKQIRKKDKTNLNHSHINSYLQWHQWPLQAIQ